jgi:hypothetical protein
MESPPFKWGDRYDLIGLAIGLVLAGVLALVGVPVLLSIVFGSAALTVSSYVLRRRRGSPTVTLWERWRTRREASR